MRIWFYFKKKRITSYERFFLCFFFHSSAIQCTKPGGTIVYSTCTLDPVQNDGVIGMSLQKIWENSKLDVAICDLSKTIQPFKPMMKFAENTRFGQLIMPCIAQNFGPMYVAKLKRIA